MRLRYTRPALADLSAILDYIAAPLATGRKAGSSPHSDCHRPAAAPSAARPPDKRSRYPADYRHAVSYVIFYEANEAEIIIHAVRHAARDPSGMPGSG